MATVNEWHHEEPTFTPSDPDLLVRGDFDSATSCQLTDISIEPVFEHNGSIDGVPAGYTTYRTPT